MTGEPQGFSQVVAGFSSYYGELREPVMLPQGSPISIRVERGSWGLLSNHFRGIWPQDALKGEFQGLSRVVEGISSYAGEVREPVMLPQGSPVSM